MTSRATGTDGRVDLAATPAKRKIPSTVPRILIVDDEPILLRSLKRLLPAYRVTMAENLWQAQETLRDSPEPYDLVLADINMPDGTGIDLARWAKAELGEGAPRFVFTSGGVHRVEDEVAIAESGYAFLPKPFRIDVLRALVERDP